MCFQTKKKIGDHWQFEYMWPDYIWKVCKLKDINFVRKYELCGPRSPAQEKKKNYTFA